MKSIEGQRFSLAFFRLRCQRHMVVIFNFLNLPTQMQFGNAFTGTKTIDVLYDASGRKLRKTVTDGTTLQYRQDYVGGIEYRTTSSVSLSLESIYHPEGRVLSH